MVPLTEFLQHLLHAQLYFQCLWYSFAFNTECLHVQGYCITRRHKLAHAFCWVMKIANGSAMSVMSWTLRYISLAEQGRGSGSFASWVLSVPHSSLTADILEAICSECNSSSVDLCLVTVFTNQTCYTHAHTLTHARTQARTHTHARARTITQTHAYIYTHIQTN